MGMDVCRQNLWLTWIGMYGFKSSVVGMSKLSRCACCGELGLTFGIGMVLMITYKICLCYQL